MISSQAQVSNQTNDSVQALLVAKMMQGQILNNVVQQPVSPSLSVTLGLSSLTSGFLNNNSYTRGLQQLQAPSHPQQMDSFTQSTTRSHSNSEIGNVTSPISSQNMPVATPQTVTDQTWYVDSEPTNHVTVDSGNLMV